MNITRRGLFGLLAVFPFVKELDEPFLIEVVNVVPRPRKLKAEWTLVSYSDMFGSSPEAEKQLSASMAKEILMEISNS